MNRKLQGPFIVFSGAIPSFLVAVEDTETNDAISEESSQGYPRTMIGAAPTRPSPPKPDVDLTAPRSTEEIEYVFSLNNSTIFALYNRALRRDPTLQGRVEIGIEIFPDGRVASCQILESGFSDEEFLKKLCQRIFTFEFTPIEADEPTTTTRLFEFYPW